MINFKNFLLDNKLLTSTFDAKTGSSAYERSFFSLHTVLFSLSGTKYIFARVKNRVNES